MHGTGVILTLFVQVALILATSRLLGWIFYRFHQPQFLGELFAGILLGPSLLGWAAPQVFTRLFPTESIQLLAILGQVGLVFFLFLIGLEFDPAIFKTSPKITAGISLATIVCPLALGVLFAILFRERFFGNARLWPSALFMGAALTAAAFPVLARILSERNLHRSSVGLISIAAAAINNLAAWCILGVALITARHSLQTILATLAFIAVMFVIVRPVLNRMQLLFEQRGKLNQNMLALMIFLILASAGAAQLVGLHALFGALLLGLLVPKNPQFIRQLCEKLQDFVMVFLLPIFFASIGLNTRVALLNTPSIWACTFLILLLASAGKFASATLTARLLKQPARNSLAIGILLNTRGLMALMILSIGLSLTLISPQIFTMLVLMVLITTALTTPLLALVYPSQLLASAKTSPTTAFSILIPISLPKSGGPLIQLADALIGTQRQSSRLIALHLRRPTEHEALHPHEEETQNHAALIPLLSQAQARALLVEPITFISSDIPADIAATAAHRQVNLILMGYHNPIFGKAMLGGTVHRVLGAAATHVAVFVDRGLRTIDRILVPYLGSAHDTLALELAAKMAKNTSARVTVLHITPPMLGQAGKLAEARRQVEQIFDNPAGKASLSFQIVEDSSPVGVILHQAPEFDLVIIGVAEEWGLESRLFGWRPEKIARDCPASLLIVRRFSQSQEIPSPSPLRPPDAPENPRVAI